jgi:rhomboid protease GluP
MALGFTSKHIEVIEHKDLTTEEILVLSLEAAKKIRWKVSHINSSGIIAFTDNGVLSWNAEIQITIEPWTSNIRSASIGNEIVDWGRNKNNIKQFKVAFEEIKSSISKEELSLKYHEIEEQLVQNTDEIFDPPSTTTAGQINGFLSVFIPRQGFFITPILLDLNILIFIAMVIGGANIMLPANESLLEWGANFRPMTLEGQWWRLITNCFLHIGVFHLLMNLYALVYIGVLLEPHLGRIRFISAYLLTGIIASIASLWWHDMTISAGASGAIFGMYGVFLAMLTTNFIEKTARKALLTSIAIFVGYNLLNGLKGGIDNAAHIGGLLGGLVIGYAFIPSLKKPMDKSLKFATIGILWVLFSSTAFVVYERLPNDIGSYDSKMKNFFSMESMALEVYNLPEGTPKEKILYGINERGIYYWNENIKLLDSFKNLNLPLTIRTRNRILREYCDLRIKSYELLYKAVSEDTDRYRLEIESFDKQIEVKIGELGGGQQEE